MFNITVLLPQFTTADVSPAEKVRLKGTSEAHTEVLVLLLQSTARLATRTGARGIAK